MLEDLRITSLGVIDDARLEFSPGLTAITGETGAGKTMLLTGVSLVLGGETDPDRVRRGQEKATVEATFTIDAHPEVASLVDESGGQVDRDGGSSYVYLARHVPASGRSRGFLGGRSVPKATLAEVGGHLVVIHGQADQLRLRSAAAQREAVDAGGGKEVASLLATYRQAWTQLRSARQDLAEFEERQASAGRERLGLQALVDAVDEVNPQPGEADEIQAKIRELDSLEDTKRSLLTALGALAGDEGDDGAVARVAAAEGALASIGNDAAAERLGAVMAELSDLQSTIGGALAGLDSTVSLDDLQSRRASLTRLSQTLGMPCDEAIEAAEAAREQLASMADLDGTRFALTQRESEAAAAVETTGAKLHEARVATAEMLAAAINDELNHLALGRASITIDVSAGEPGPDGLDAVSFLFAPDRGATPVPLATSASGGELSRIMLAIELVLAEKAGGQSPTFIFDEIDAGVGGEAAKAIGSRLARLGQDAQVIVVTHLAQVASWADRHITVIRGENATTIRAVEGDDRVEELARMLSGSASLDSARRHAEDLLAASNVGR